MTIPLPDQPREPSPEYWTTSVIGYFQVSMNI